jgi:transposase InsO family protein
MSKQRVIVESVLAGRSQGEVARLYGISQPRVSQLVAAWRSGGWDALEPKSRRPRTNPNATPPEVVDRILALRAGLVADGCDAGPHSIAGILDDELETPPGVTTIWRILTRAGVVTPEPRKRPKQSWIRFEADLPNQCWQADFTHVALADSIDTEVLLFIDDHSRYLLSATAHARVTGPTVVAAFRAACATYGTPQSTLTDNGLVFTTRFRGGPNGFEVLLADLGVTQKNGAPNHPQTQGKVERLNQTLKKWLAAWPPAATISALQHLLDEFTDHYNHRRKHRSLNRRTPAAVYAARAKASPDHNTGGHFRIRDDTTDAGGKVTLRRGGRLHHISLGTEHARTHIRMLVHDLHITVINRDTGEILRELVLDPDTDNQPLGRRPGPPPGGKKGGMKKGYKFPPK